MIAARSSAPSPVGPVARGLDRLRTFAGLEVPLKGRSTLEIGYLNQTVNGPAARVTMDHIVSVTLSARQ